MEISSIIYFPRHSRLTVRFRHHLYSSQIPTLAQNLFAMLPTLREHLCTNRNGLSFAEEANDTELGHVFEHVMLAILHRRGVRARGQTTWNWQRDPLGTYHVTIGTGKKCLVKESALIAQAIFTNALHGPLLKVRLPAEADATVQALWAEPLRQPARLLFGSEPEAARTNPGQAGVRG